MRMKDTAALLKIATAQVLSLPVQLVCVHTEGVSLNHGFVMVKQIALMPLMSTRIAPGDPALERSSSVTMACVSPTTSGVTGTMTVVTTVMSGAVCTLPAARTFLRVRTDSALIRPMSVMGTMTVEITLMSWSTSVTPQKPHVPLISSGVTMGTALRW